MRPRTRLHALGAALHARSHGGAARPRRAKLPPVRAGFAARRGRQCVRARRPGRAHGGREARRSGRTLPIARWAPLQQRRAGLRRGLARVRGPRLEAPAAALRRRASDLRLPPGALGLDRGQSALFRLSADHAPQHERHARVLRRARHGCRARGDRELHRPADASTRWQQTAGGSSARIRHNG